MESSQEERPKAGLLKSIRGGIRLAWDTSPAGFLLIATLTAIPGLVPPTVIWLTKKMVDQVARALQEHVGFEKVVPIVIALGFATALQHLLNSIGGNRNHVFSLRVSDHAEDCLMDAVSKADAAHFDSATWHDRMQRAARDAARPGMLTFQVIGLGRSLLGFAGLATILATLHPLLIVLALIAALIPIPLQRRITRLNYSFWWSDTPREREMHYLRDVLSESRTAKDIRAFALQDHLLKSHRSVTADRLAFRESISKKAERSALFGALATGIAVGIAYVFVATRAARGQYTPGDITALVAALAGLIGMISSMANTLVRIEEHGVFLDDYFSFLNLEQSLSVPSSPATLPLQVFEIDFENVEFSYPGMEEKAISGIDLSIRKGELIALVGENGAGKTTLVKLLLRFYDPQRGSIALGGIDFKDLDPRHLRERIGVLFQDSTGYDFTARENVIFGRVESQAGDAAVWDALEKARAADLVRKLPKGLDSNIGRRFEGGHDLSGGEWQRLALARLMYRDADIWILDEPTASLDPETEAAIFAELKQNLSGRTGIIISHRFSTVRLADRIAVIEQGKIIEMGSHDELISLGGRYSHLFELQAAGYR